jgi:type I restriction enzyme M protein
MADRRAAAEARAALQPVFDRLASIETELTPYECIKEQLAEARARYRELTGAFVDELKTRCAIMGEDEKRALVLELFAQDVQVGLDTAVGEKRQELALFIGDLWDKYCVTLINLYSPNYSPIPKTDRARCFGVQDNSPNSRLTRASSS